MECESHQTHFCQDGVVIRFLAWFGFDVCFVAIALDPAQNIEAQDLMRATEAHPFWFLNRKPDHCQSLCMNKVSAGNKISAQKNYSRDNVSCLYYRHLENVPYHQWITEPSALKVGIHGRGGGRDHSQFAYVGQTPLNAFVPCLLAARPCVSTPLAKHLFTIRVPNVRMCECQAPCCAYNGKRLDQGLDTRISVSGKR
jgi:hypothetical protein